MKIRVPKTTAPPTAKKSAKSVRSVRNPSSQQILCKSVAYYLIFEVKYSAFSGQFASMRAMIRERLL